MKNQKFINRFGIAWAGIRAAWKTERSFKTQTGFATALLFALLRRVYTAPRQPHHFARLRDITEFFDQIQQAQLVLIILS